MEERRSERERQRKKRERTGEKERILKERERNKARDRKLKEKEQFTLKIQTHNIIRKYIPKSNRLDVT